MKYIDYSAILYPGLSSELTLSLENYTQKTHRKIPTSRFFLKSADLMKNLVKEADRLDF